MWHERGTHNLRMNQSLFKYIWHNDIGLGTTMGKSETCNAQKQKFNGSVSQILNKFHMEEEG